MYQSIQFHISQEDFHGNAPDIGFMEYELIILLGDVNLDGSINVQDIVTMVAIILDTISPVDDQIIASDINVDGIVDILDIIATVNIVLNNTESVESADINGDGNYNIMDIVILANCILAANCEELG